MSGLVAAQNEAHRGAERCPELIAVGRERQTP